MSYVEYLQKTIDYIEENIKQPITIEVCADVAGFSKYHFYRLFTLLVGVPLMEYVRKRRLAFAMQEVNRGRRIIDIALDFEYSSERSFCRAFQKEFGKTPSKFRNKHYAILRITNPFSNPFEAIPAGWNKLVEWVNTKGYEPNCRAECYKEKYWLEEKLEENGITYMDVYFPLN